MSLLCLLFFDFSSNPSGWLRALNLLVTEWVIGRSFKFLIRSFIFIINNIYSIFKRVVTGGVTLTDCNRSDTYKNQQLSEKPLPGLYPGHFNY